MRSFDILLAVVLTTLLALPMLLLAILIKISSPGPALYWSDRVGLNNTLFRMPKFRTMKVETPAVATHLLTSPDQYLTRIGRVLRKYSLDELPIPVKVTFDEYYLNHRSLAFDLKIMFTTIFNALSSKGVRH
jgi:lipopolysaccharide/colanic/teichoic acid biosynthesis glycosyltransferase